jgi:hypothetical protein
VSSRRLVDFYETARNRDDIAVHFIEIKLKIGSGKERLDAIAQVIAECDGQAYSWC